MKNSENGGRAEDFMKLSFAARPENEEFARVTAAVFLSRLDPTVEETEDVKTAVSEAVTNCIIHGYGGGPGTVYIESHTEENRFIIRISDTGRGIPDIEKAMEPMFTTDRTGERSGMGFSFMEAFMDEVKVESEPGKGTVLTMVKTIGRRGHG